MDARLSSQFEYFAWLENSAWMDVSTGWGLQKVEVFSLSNCFFTRVFITTGNERLDGDGGGEREISSCLYA